MSSRAGRVVLLLVIVLHLVADSALSPFYPRLFRELYGITDLSATGAYVWVCRVAAVAALPMWGLAARRWPLHRIVVAGLLASSVLDAVLGFAPTYAAFTAISATLVATTMSMALAYPAFVSLGRGDRLRDVRLYAMVFHIGTVAATLVGAGVMALPDIRYGISAFALLDLVLAYSCRRVLGRAPVHDAGKPEPVAPRVPGVGAVVTVAAIVLVAEVGRTVIRPFFTAYAETGGISTGKAALLFLLPSVAVLAVLPAADAARRRLGEALLPVAFLGAACGLAVQAMDPQLLTLAAGRLLFGAGVGLGQVALDLRMFKATGTEGPAFAAVETTRTVALVVSPVIATAAASVSLPLPLAAGSALFWVLALLLALEAGRSRHRSPLAASPSAVKAADAGKDQHVYQPG